MNCQYSDSVQDRYIVPSSFGHPYFPCVSPSKPMEDMYLNAVPYGSLKTTGEYEYDSRVKASQELPQGFSVSHLLQDLQEARVRGQPYLNETAGYPGDCQTPNAGQTGFGFEREGKEGPYHVKGEQIRPPIAVGGDAMQDPPSAGPGSAAAFEERLAIKQQIKTPTPETKKKPKGIHSL